MKKIAIYIDKRMEKMIERKLAEDCESYRSPLIRRAIKEYCEK
tara:strand:- start:439 stop:567 length:129 start_codon:yes stop_codon:yes gene_type:complete